MQYYITCKRSNENGYWRVAKAKTLLGAKREASEYYRDDYRNSILTVALGDPQEPDTRDQITADYQNSTLLVATRESGEPIQTVVVASKRITERKWNNVFSPVLDLVVQRLRNCWVIRPKHTLGTCGWINGIPWAVRYVKRLPKNIPVVE
jgi:hypothetical protein